MYYIKSEYFKYPLRRDEFFGDSVDVLLKRNPTIHWLEEVQEIPSFNDNVLLWNPFTALHCFLDRNEAKIINLLKKGLSIDRLKSNEKLNPKISNEELIKHLFLRSMVSLNDQTFIPLDIYEDGPVFEERFLVELLLSESCNLSCRYCFAEPNKKRPPMSREVAMAAVDKAMQLPAPAFAIEFGGGETFLYYQAFTEIVKEIRKKANKAGKDVLILVQTNGTLLHQPKILKFLEKYHVRIGISLDGPPALNDLSRPYQNGKGSSKEIVKTIKLLELLGHKNISFLTVVNRFNVDSPEAIVDYFNSLHSSGGMFLPTLRLGAAESAWDETGIEPVEYFDFMKRMMNSSGYGTRLQCLMVKRLLDNLMNPSRDFRCMRSRCGAGNDYIVVDSRGDIFPCSHHVHREELKMGNIHDPVSLHEYLTPGSFLDELYSTRKVKNISTCSRCSWRHLCEAGCSLDSFYQYGQMTAGSTLCGYYKKMYPFLLHSCLEHPEMLSAYLHDEVEVFSC